jgi:hypothetical protein
MARLGRDLTIALQDDGLAAHVREQGSYQSSQRKRTFVQFSTCTKGQDLRRSLGDDPLPAAVEPLREMLEATVGVANTSQVFAKLVNGLDGADRSAALKLFLNPSQSRPS